MAVCSEVRAQGQLLPALVGKETPQAWETFLFLLGVLGLTSLMAFPAACGFYGGSNKLEV